MVHQNSGTLERCALSLSLSAGIARRSRRHRGGPAVRSPKTGARRAHLNPHLRRLPALSLLIPVKACVREGRGRGGGELTTRARPSLSVAALRRGTSLGRVPAALRSSPGTPLPLPRLRAVARQTNRSFSRSIILSAVNNDSLLEAFAGLLGSDRPSRRLNLFVEYIHQLTSNAIMHPFNLCKKKNNKKIKKK